MSFDTTSIQGLPSTAAAEPEVTIIIISYNTCKLTVACIESVIAQTSVPYELIVLDNNSTDDSANTIERQFPNIHFIRSNENYGFARGNNVVAKHATSDLLLLLNPDTVVLENAIDTLVAFASKRPGDKIWGGRTVFGDNSLNPTSCWRKMSLWSLASQAMGLSSIFRSSRLFNAEAYGGWKRDCIQHVDIITGCFFLIETSLWNQLGGFDEQFFMYGEEADLCMRAKILGARPLLCPDATIIHYGGASEPTHPNKGVRLLKAKTHLLHRHMPHGTRSIAKLLLKGWPLSRYIASRILSAAKINPPLIGWGEIWHRRKEWAVVEKTWR